MAGLWDNIHAKRKRGETMRNKGDKGAPTDAAFKKAQGMNKGGAMHRMPDGTMMKGASHGYNKGGMANCGASMKPARYSCGGMVHKKGK